MPATASSCTAAAGAGAPAPSSARRWCCSATTPTRSWRTSTGSTRSAARAAGPRAPGRPRPCALSARRADADRPWYDARTACATDVVPGRRGQTGRVTRHIELPEAVRQKASALGAEGEQWLADLPAIVDGLATDWELDVGPAFTGGSGAFVAPATTRDGVE